MGVIWYIVVFLVISWYIFFCCNPVFMNKHDFYEEIKSSKHVLPEILYNPNNMIIDSGKILYKDDDNKNYDDTGSKGNIMVVDLQELQYPVICKPNIFCGQSNGVVKISDYNECIKIFAKYRSTNNYSAIFQG